MPKYQAARCRRAFGWKNGKNTPLTYPTTGVSTQYYLCADWLVSVRFWLWLLSRHVSNSFRTSYNVTS